MGFVTIKHDPEARVYRHFNTTTTNDNDKDDDDDDDDDDDEVVELDKCQYCRGDGTTIALFEMISRLVFFQ